MNKIKLLVPFATLFAMTLSSCNKNDIPNITPLNRVRYKEANSYTELVSTFAKMYEDQFPTQPTQDEKNNYVDGKSPFKIYEQGTETVQYRIKVSGTLKLDYINEFGAYPINYNNIDVALADTITVSWDISNKEKPYLKIVNKHESYYVGLEKLPTGDYNLYRYHNLPVKNKLYKTNFDYLKSSELDYFSDTILWEALLNSSILLSSPFWGQKIRNDSYVGFDLSGFIYPEIYSNSYSFHKGNLLSPGYWLKNQDIAAQLDQFALINPIQELSFRCASDSLKTASMEIKLDKCDLSEYSSLFEVMTGLRTAGKANFDYFVAYADSLIKQQEFILDVKNGSALGVVTGGSDWDPVNTRGYNYNNVVVVDANNLNISIHANQEVSNKCETVDEYNPNDYIAIAIW